MNEDTDFSQSFGRRNFFKLTTGLVALGACSKSPPPTQTSLRSFLPNYPSKEKLEKDYERYEFSFNENPIGCSPSIGKITLSPLDLCRYEYLYQNYESLVEVYATQLGVSKDYIQFGPGSTELLKRSLLHQKLAHKKKLVMSPFDWPKYARLAREYGWEIETVNYNDFAHDLDGFLQKSKDASLMYLTNPNLPFATQHSKSDLISFIKKVDPKTLIIIDECYMQFTSKDWQNESLAPLTKEFPNLIISQTFSKFFALGPVRIGAFIATPELFKNYGIREPEVLDVSVFAFIAAQLALKDEKHQQDTREYCSEVIKSYQNYFSELGQKYVSGKTNYGALILPKGSQELRKYLSKNLGYRNFVWINSPYLLVCAGNKEHVPKYLKDLTSALKATGQI